MSVRATRASSDSVLFSLVSACTRPHLARNTAIPCARLFRSDTGGDIDVAVIELDRAALPRSVVLRCFTPAHLQHSLQEEEAGASLLIVGFPPGLHDVLHHLPVMRQAVIASSFGLRFQGSGYFLTDARTHRGTSGAPVVMRSPSVDSQPPGNCPAYATERKP